MTWWGYVIVYVGLSINLGSLAINAHTMMRSRKQLQCIDELIQRAKLLGYQQGYKDGSVK